MRVKICGLTNLEDALVAARAGADFLGFICYPRSSRYISPEEAGRIIGALRQAGVTAPAVGVFVNARLSDIRRAIAVAGFDLVQLHGDEPPEVVAALSGRAFKALRPRTSDDVEQALAFARVAPAVSDFPQLLVDAYHPAAYGGTGHPGDWGLAHEIARRVPRLLLAGGLTPDNVAEAVARVRPWGVDVSSGVERAPGEKDHEKIRRFIAAARGETGK